MQVLYGADTGIEDALYTLDNLGNGTSPKVPVNKTDDPVTYYLPGYTNESEVKVTIDKDGNGTYLITSTGTNTQNRKVTVQVHVQLAPKQIPVGPIYVPGEGNVSTSPFDYAMASLDPTTGPDFKTHPPNIKGDVYSNGPIDFGSGAIVQSDGYHAGNVWAKGTVTMESGVSIAGSVHSGGDIIMQGTASIGISAYAEGSIQATGATSWIQESAGAYGAINVQNGSGIGHSTVAYGDIHVSGPLSGWGFNVGGNVASNDNIAVDNNGKIVGNAAAGGTVTTNSGGNIGGTIAPPGQPQFTLTLPEIPTLVAQDVAYWQNKYKTEAMTGPGHVTYGDYTTSGNPKHVDFGNTYITGNLNVKNGYTIHLQSDTTVYVEGWVDIKSGANIMGTGKLVAVGDINLFNNLVGDANAMPLLMTLGCLNMQNNCNIYAVLYAPNCSVDVQNWDSLTGSLVAQNISAGQGFKATWTPAVANIPGLPGGNVTQGNGTWIPVEQPPLIEYTGVHIDYYKVCDDETCS
jgi:cytoskeletal protein CcmA (bactofilin family)